MPKSALHLALLCLGWFVFAESAHGQFEGYSGYAYATERSELASSETGVIAKVLVKEGEFVEAGQPLVQLDEHTFRLQVESARLEASNRSEIEAVEKRIAIQQESLNRLERLLDSGNARPSEWDRETMELEALKASLQQKHLEWEARKIQLQRAQKLLEKRTIRAPFDGQVAKIHRQVGEFVSPNSPEVVTLVDSRTLIAEFQLPVVELNHYQKNSSVPIRVGSQKLNATVRSVGVQVDPASQTVKVKVAIDNRELTFRTGIDCVLITAY